MRAFTRLVARILIILSASWSLYLWMEAPRGTFSDTFFTDSSLLSLTLPPANDYLRSDGVDTTYPDWFEPNPEQDKRDLNHWLSVLPLPSDRDANAYIVVPRIGVIVPIHTIGDNSVGYYLAHPHEYFRHLEDGVVQHPGSISPVSGTGNYVLAGHTSYYAKQPGHYKTIFQFLSLIKKGDLAIVFIEDDQKVWQRFFYSFDHTFITEADNTSILDQRHEEFSLTLYGCYPFGSLEKRIVSYAHRVFLD